MYFGKPYFYHYFNLLNMGTETVQSTYSLKTIQKIFFFFIKNNLKIFITELLNII